MNTGSAERTLRIIGHSPIGFQVLNRLSGSRRVYRSFAEAEVACQKLRRPSHDSPVLIKGNFRLSLNLRPSDYPVLFWLSRIGLSGPIKVFDFGGGIGQTCYCYSKYLPVDMIGLWMVMDLQEVIDRSRLSGKVIPSYMKFSASLRDCCGCNVFLASGSFHYWDHSFADLDTALGGLPEHILINRSPISGMSKSFVTIQTGDHWAVPCRVRSRKELVDEFSQLGYQAVDEWQVNEKTLELPVLPEYTAPYRGFYLRLNRPSVH